MSQLRFLWSTRYSVRLPLLLATLAAPALQPAAASSRDLVFEAEALEFIASAGEVADPIGPQEMAAFGPHWSGGAQLFWGVGRANEELALSVEVPEVGSYEALVRLTRAPDFGQVGISFGGSVPVVFDGYAPTVSIAEVTLGVHDLSAGSHSVLIRQLGKSDFSNGYFVGIDRIELRLREPVPAVTTVSSDLLRDSDPLEPWTTQDVIDPRIDVGAQYALMRMFRGDPIERAAASNILSAVKAGDVGAPPSAAVLGGVYQEDQKIPALRAQAQGFGWWQILPKTAPPISIDGVCMRGADGEAPILVMRKQAEKSPVAYDRSLMIAWAGCEFSPAPVRPYKTTLPPRPQAAAKATRCAVPSDRSSLGVAVYLDGGGADLAVVVGARVTIEGKGDRLGLDTDDVGLAFFDHLKAGLFRVTAEGGTPPLPHAIAMSAEVLPNCGNYVTINVKKAEPAAAGGAGWAVSCNEILTRARWTCLTPESLGAHQHCQDTYVKGLLGCKDVQLELRSICEGKLVVLYSDCVTTAYKKQHACELRESGGCLAGES